MASCAPIVIGAQRNPWAFVFMLVLMPMFGVGKGNGRPVKIVLASVDARPISP